MTKLYQILWGIYLASYPIAVIGVAFDVQPGFSLAWAGSVLLMVQGALAVLWLLLRLGVPQGGRAALLIAIGAYLGESIGVATGFPFGAYNYTKVLFPILPGSVPLPVIGAWLMVVVTSAAVAPFLNSQAATPIANTKHPWRARVWRLGYAALIGVMLDYVLEPAAVHIEHYWVWHTNSTYYGIPTTNFLGWALLCMLLLAMLPRTLPITEDASLRVPLALPSAQRFPWLHALLRTPSPVVLYMLTLLMFTIVDATHGLNVAAWQGTIVLIVLVLKVRFWAGYAMIKR